MLPDPLARLQAQYNQLVDDVERGNISFEDATASLDQMLVVDGAGQHWSIDVQGQFTVAPGPGVPQQPADPSGFAADRLPPRADAQDVPPWSDPHLMGGPADPAPHGGPPWPGDQGGMGGPGPLPAHMQPNLGRAKHLGDDPDDSAPARLKRGVKGAGQKIASSGLLAKLPGDKRTGMVIVAGLLLLVVVFVYTKLGTDPLDSVDSGVPVEQPAGDPAPAPGGQMPDGDSEPAPEAPAAAPLPTGEDVNRVIGALTSGERDIAASVLTINGGTANTVLQTASMAGLDKADVALSSGPATEADGAVHARFVLSDAIDGTEYAEATVTWVQVDGVWKLETWPVFTRTE